MDYVFQSLGPLVIIGVAIVLLMGLWNMLREGAANRSQKLMRWRVGLQFVAVCILMIGLYLKS